MNENLNNNLVCNSCGNVNELNTKFCIKCGSSLDFNVAEKNDVSSIEVGQNEDFKSTQQVFSDNSMQQNLNDFTQQTIYNSTISNNQATNNSIEIKYYLQYIVRVVLKPFDTFKQNEEKLFDFKNIGILSLIIVGFMTIIGLINTMINTVRVTSFWTDEVEWVWENLKEIEYFKVIGQNILIYAGILLAISGIYFLASLVIKKEVKFPKLLDATVTAFIPFAMAISIFSPLLSLIYSPLGICITIVGFIYTLVILLELMNELIKIGNKNTRIYFHITCLSILIIGCGFIAYKLILGSLSSGLGGLSSLFG